jgi:hypothetical protein
VLRSLLRRLNDRTWSEGRKITLECCRRRLQSRFLNFRGFEGFLDRRLQSCLFAGRRVLLVRRCEDGLGQLRRLYQSLNTGVYFQFLRLSGYLSHKIWFRYFHFLLLVPALRRRSFPAL